MLEYLLLRGGDILRPWKPNLAHGYHPEQLSTLCGRRLTRVSSEGVTHVDLPVLCFALSYRMLARAPIGLLGCDGNEYTLLSPSNKIRLDGPWPKDGSRYLAR